MKVGDVLWFAPGARWQGQPRAVRISKIGRRWWYISETDSDREVGRIAISSIRLDGYSCGSVYENEAAYEEAKRVKDRWRELRDKVSRHYNAPSHLSLWSIEQMIAAIERSEA